MPAPAPPEKELIRARGYQIGACITRASDASVSANRTRTRRMLCRNGQASQASRPTAAALRRPARIRVIDDGARDADSESA